MNAKLESIMYCLLLASILWAGVSVNAMPESTEAYLTQWCSGIVFRETPYSDIRCANPLSKKDAEHIKHFQLDFDRQNRLIEVRYQLGERLVAFSDRFIRAPKTQIRYRDNLEIRHYFDEHGLPTLVSGEVFRSVFTRNSQGRRESLAFYGLDGKAVENDFGIAAYRWQTLPDGQVVETRSNRAGEIVRNRPGFGYMVTRFAFDSDGLLTRMLNLGADGKTLTADAAGVAMTQIGYTREAMFRQWLNLDTNGKPRKGMSDIAEIRYQPSSFRGEQEAWFFDANGEPQETRWGVHRVSYAFDQHGNAIVTKYYDSQGNRTVSNSGIAEILSNWSPDGLTKVREAYFGYDHKKVVSSTSGVHAQVTEIDEKSRPMRHYFVDTAENRVVHQGLGYAQELRRYDAQGGLSERQFLDVQGVPATHQIWGVQRIVYRRGHQGMLLAVNAYDHNDQEVQIRWNPDH